MKIKFYISAILIILIFPLVSSAQKVGYMGRRFMIKLNVVNGLRPLYAGGEVEYALHRKITLSAGGGYQTGKYKQLYYTQYLYTGLANDVLYYNKRLSKKDVTINAFSFFGQLKFFPFNRLKSAPDGFYLGIKAGAGYANVDSKSGYPISINIYPTNTYVPESFKIKYVPFASYEFGPGIQKILWGRFVVDAAAYFNVTTFNKTGTSASQEYTATIARQFGPNTAWLGASLTDKPNEYGSTDAKDVNPRRFTDNFGVSLYLKIGVLLF